MRKLFTLLILGSSILSAHAQKSISADVPTALFKFSPQHLFANSLGISAEFFNENHKLSNQISLLMKYREGFNDGSSGFGFEYMVKAYPGRFKTEKRLGVEKVAGYYAGFFAQGFVFNDHQMESLQTPNPPYYVEQKAEVRNSGFYGGFTMGRQVSLGEHFYIDMFLGAGIRIASSNANFNNTSLERDLKEFLSPGYSGIMPKMGISIGIGF